MKRPDFSVLIGWTIGLAAIGGGAVLEGIRLKFLWQPTAALVVFGGTFGAVVVRRGVRGVREAIAASYALCLRENNDELEATFARLARREGVRAFEAQAQISQDPLVSTALALAADYTEPAEVQMRLERLLDAEDERGLGEIATLEAAGSYAPTFGIIGAVLGLIFVLRSLADPGALGL